MSPRRPRRRLAACWTSGPHRTPRSPLQGLLPHRSASRSSVLLSVSLFGPSASLPTMASADFYTGLREPLGPRSTAAPVQISPGIAHPLSRLYASDIRHRVPYTYRALHLFACSPHSARLYPLPVRRASALPPASFRPPVAREALAVQLTLPRVGHVEDFHLQEKCALPGARRKGRRPKPPALVHVQVRGRSCT